MTNLEFILNEIKTKIPSYQESEVFKESPNDWEYSVFYNLTSYVLNNVESKKWNEDTKEVTQYFIVLNDLLKSDNETLKSVANTEGLEIIATSEDFNKIASKFIAV